MLLGHGLTRDLTVDSTGRAVETVTSGPTVWTRSASTVDGLAAAPWAFRTVAGRTVLGTAAVTVVVLSAKDPREEAPDPAGRRVIHATVPAADRPAGYGDLLAGADVVLTLDEDGDVARIVVRSAPDDPELVLELDIARVGEPQTIAPPHSGNAGLRRTVPIDELEAAGVRPVELGRVPAGWTLTGAWVAPGPVGPAECPRLNLSVLASLRPFDTETELTPLAGIPSA